MAELAFEAAARHFERALGSIELEDVPDREVRCDLLIAWARALHDGGDERARRMRAEAVALARELGDADRFATAALVRSDNPMGSWDGTRADTEFVAMLEEALERLPDCALTGTRPPAVGSGDRAVLDQPDRAAPHARQRVGRDGA